MLVARRRRSEGVDRRRLPPLRRARRRRRASRSGSRGSSARWPPSGGRATWPRLPPNDLASSPLADELSRARRLPRRRQRRRARRLRPLPPPAQRRGRGRAALGSVARTWLTVSGLVRLRRGGYGCGAWRQSTRDRARARRFGQLLRERRLQIALLDRARRRRARPRRRDPVVDRRRCSRSAPFVVYVGAAVGIGARRCARRAGSPRSPSSWSCSFRRSHSCSPRSRSWRSSSSPRRARAPPRSTAADLARA